MNRAEISHVIQRAQLGDRESLEDLLNGLRNYLSLLARNWGDASLKCKADPSDLVQDTLLKAFQHFDQFQGHSEPELAAWLRRILARTVIDAARRYKQATSRQLAREQSLEDFLDHSSQALHRFVTAAARSPSHSASQRELCVVLADALAQLNDDYREVIVLRNLQELEWESVAARMNRSVGAVRMLWARALRQLRPAIEAML